MSRSDRDSWERKQRQAEKEARRAQRLSDRAEDRAQRRAVKADEASRRADALADRAQRRRSPRDRELGDSIEDYVDQVTEKWSRKAENWLEEQSGRLFDDDGSTGRSQRSRRSRHQHESSMTADDDYQSEEYTYASDRSRNKSRRRRFRRWKKRMLSNRRLYRDKDNAKVCGVCAGIAEYWQVETWQVRCAAVMGLFFLFSLTVPAYFILCFLMDDKPYYKKVTDRFDGAAEYESKRRNSGRTMKTRGRQKQFATSNAEAMSTARMKFEDIEDRLRAMEAQVTSSKFELNREFKKMAGESGHGS